MASIKIVFQARTFVQVAKMQQQFVNQLRPLGYELEKIESSPISEKTIETTLILNNKKKKAKEV